MIFESKVKEMELVNESAVKRNEGLMKQLEEFQCERSRLSQEVRVRVFKYLTVWYMYVQVPT